MNPLSRWFSNESRSITNQGSSSNSHLEKQTHAFNSEPKRQSKIVFMYDFLFKKYQGDNQKSFIMQFNDSIHGHDQRRAQIQDWDDFFILSPNVTHLKNILDSLDPNESLKRKYSFIHLIQQIIIQLEDYIKYLETLHQNAKLQLENDSSSEQLISRNHSFDIRASNAIITLICILFSLYSKNWNNSTICLLTLITGDISMSDVFFEKLTKIIRDIIQNSLAANSVRLSLLRLIQSFLVGKSSLNQNALIDYFNIYPIFYEPLTQSILIPSLSNRFGQENDEMKLESIRVLLLLSNYRKYEIENIYLGYIRRENRAKTLFYLGELITNFLHDACSKFQKLNESLLLPSTYTMIQSHNLSDTKRYNWNHQFGNRLANLLGNPISLLSQIIPSNDNTPTFALLNRDSLPNILPILLVYYELIYTNTHFVKILTGSLSKISRKEELNQENNTNDSKDSKVTETKMYNKVNSNQIQKVDLAIPDVLKQFMTYCSIIFYHDNDYDPYISPLTHLSIITWICLLENDLFLDFIFDVHVSIKTLLIHKESQKTYLHPYNGVGCVARLIYEILFEYVHHHAKSDDFPIRHMRKVFATLHTLLGNASIRGSKLDINYIQLVSTCINVLQISYAQKHFHLVLQILRFLNMLLLCSEFLAPNLDAQCEIIYELARGKDVFDRLLSYITSKEFETDLSKQSNIPPSKTFRDLIENPLQVSEFVSRIVESTFRTLNLGQSLRILRENLEHIPLEDIPGIQQIQLSYLENPNNTQFFIQLQVLLAKSTRKRIKKSLEKSSS